MSKVLTVRVSLLNRDRDDSPHLQPSLRHSAKTSRSRFIMLAHHFVMTAFERWCWNSPANNDIFGHGYWMDGAHDTKSAFEERWVRIAGSLGYTDASVFYVLFSVWLNA